MMLKLFRVVDVLCYRVTDRHAFPGRTCDSHLYVFIYRSGQDASGGLFVEGGKVGTSADEADAKGRSNDDHGIRDGGSGKGTSTLPPNPFSRNSATISSLKFHASTQTTLGCAWSISSTEEIRI